MRLFERKIRKSNQLARAPEILDFGNAKIARLSTAIALKSRLSVPARRIFAMLVGVLNENPQQLETQIDLNDLEAVTGANLLTKDYDFCIAAIGLVNFRLKTDKGFYQLQIFEDIKYEYGSKKVTATFTPKGAKFINQVMPYTTYYLSDYVALSSTYSQPLFEWLNSWGKIKSPFIPINELQELLHFPETYLKDTHNIKRKVLDIAKKEMLEKIKFRFSYKFKKVKTATGEKNIIVDFHIGDGSETSKILKPKQAAYLCARNHVNKSIGCKIYGDAKYEYKDYQEEQKCTQCRICKYIEVLRQKKLAKQAEQIKNGLFD